MVNELGKIQVYTGDGKGKTTAALGLSIRALGRGLRVKIIYFDKGGSNYGERKILDFLAQTYPISYVVTGLDRIDTITKTFRFGVKEEDKREAKRGLDLIKEIFSHPDCDLLVLDELNTTISLEMLDIKDVMSVLDNKSDNLELIITGRNCSKEILERADLVSEVKMVKHYFTKGTKAREGIEF